jgi:hypothetical protein
VSKESELATIMMHVASHSQLASLGQIWTELKILRPNNGFFQLEQGIVVRKRFLLKFHSLFQIFLFEDFVSLAEVHVFDHYYFIQQPHKLNIQLYYFDPSDLFDQTIRSRLEGGK